MEKKDIEHLATLARIELSDEEKVKFAESITDILGYVSQVTDIAASEKEKKVEGIFNVMREDIESHEPGAYTEKILGAAPYTKGQHVEVKKILGDIT